MAFARRARDGRLLAALLAALVVLAAGRANAQSGLQVTPDSKRILVSKDLGGQRWAISHNPDGTVIGNVFFPGGGAPQFVWCRETGRTATDVQLACSGADACPLAPCTTDEWVFIADVSLPLSFFGGLAPAPTASFDVAGMDVGAVPQTPLLPVLGRPIGDASARIAAAGTPSGIQIAPQGSLALISKDVGDQRWAISRNEDGTVTGNVFFPGGGQPQFVWCEPTGTSTDPLGFRCSGADPCPGGSGAGCAGAGWSFIADVTLPASFLQPRDRVGSRQLIDAITQRFGEDGGFDAVALAIDRGYSLRQIARAALSGRLLATGEISARNGGLEAPAGTGAHVFTSAQAHVSALTLTIEEFRTKFKSKTGNDFGTLLALVLLTNGGYDLGQMLDFLQGNGSIRIDNPPRLLDGSGATIRPSEPPDDPFVDQEVCGDSLVQAPEVCDTELHGETCLSIGLGDGVLDCRSDCTYDTSGCTRPGRCGNGFLEGLEQCDGNNLAGATCQSLGFPGGGELTCSLGCAFDKSRCIELQCGNGKREGLEQCDGGDLAGQTCQSLGYQSGALTCSSGCAFDKHACIEVGCGNGKRDGDESCDGGDLGGATCASRGFAGGSLGCDGTCSYDTSACTPIGTCTGGTVACEGGCVPSGADCCEGEGGFCSAGSVCTGTGKCCPSAHPQACGNACIAASALCCGPGTKVCGGACISLDVGCCGNGVAEPGEQCDGSDLGGATCSGTGSVHCTGGCTLDRSGCQQGCPSGSFQCGQSCAPNGSVCCPGTGLHCDAGDVCASGGGGTFCCPAGSPTLCGGQCYASGVVCCGTYACNAGHTCLGDNHCG